MPKTSCIIIVGGTWGFPLGMAAAKRVALLGRIFLDVGFHVEIIHTTVSEKPGKIINPLAEGTYQGLHFTYATGSTVASANFLMRRLVELKGLLNTVTGILRLSRRYDLKAIVIYSRQLSSVALIRAAAGLAKTPTILELNEWTVARKNIALYRRVMAGAFCRLSPLIVDGFIVISSFIKGKICRINSAASRRICRVPILVDAKTLSPGVDKSCRYKSETATPYVLFSGSLDYIEALRFIIDVFCLVKKEHSSCRLVITGKTGNSSREKQLSEAVQQAGLNNSVDVKGYVSDMALKQLQRDAACLLAPLENDDQSRARMPTKIAEYLLTGRPVITTDIGDVRFYLTNGINAYLCPPGDIRAFSKAILQILNDDKIADSIGSRGREIAAKAFDYRIYYEQILQLVHVL